MIASRLQDVAVELGRAEQPNKGCHQGCADTVDQRRKTGLGVGTKQPEDEVDDDHRFDDAEDQLDRLTDPVCRVTALRIRIGQDRLSPLGSHDGPSLPLRRSLHGEPPHGAEPGAA